MTERDWKGTEMDEVNWTKIPINKDKTPETPETPEAPGGDPLSITDQGGSSETVAKTPETPDNFGNTSTSEEVFLKHLARWKDTLRLPDIVTESRPSLQSVIAYAFRGAWGPEDGLIRALGKLDAVILGIPVIALLYTLGWLWERPSRRLISIGFTNMILWYFGWLWWA